MRLFDNAIYNLNAVFVVTITCGYLTLDKLRCQLKSILDLYLVVCPIIFLIIRDNSLNFASHLSHILNNRSFLMLQTVKRIT